MKNLIKKFSPPLFFAACVIAGLIAGCASPIVTPGAPASTNAITGQVIPATQTVTNYVPNTTVTTGVAYAQTVAPLVPAPWGEALAAILAITTAVASGIAAKKNGQLNTANAVASTIIQGVESAGTAAVTVKQSVAKQAMANGTANQVEAAVNALTGSA
jgi:hypothetical protein